MRRSIFTALSASLTAKASPVARTGNGRPTSACEDPNYIFFHADPKAPDSAFGTGLAKLVATLNTDFDWLREHTRYLQRATEWDAGGRPENRLLSGNDIPRGQGLGGASA
jgi:hypothetical protein